MVRAKRISFIFVADDNIKDEEIQERLPSMESFLDDIGISSKLEISDIEITEEAVEKIREEYA